MRKFIVIIYARIHFLNSSILQMRFNLILVTLLSFTFVSAGLVSEVTAQSTLNRISTMERSDGKGFVIRHHLTERVDSFKVRQASPDYIQMKLFSEGLDTLNLRLPGESGVFREFTLHSVPGGLGVDISLGAGSFFKINAYLDRNGRDVLIALERTTADEAEELTENVEPYSWDWGPVPKEDEEEEFNGQNENIDNTFLQLNDNSRFDVIVLDAGHGGKDPGTINHQLGLREKDVVLDVTLKVGKYIEEKMPGVEVIYTRTDDSFVELEERGLSATRVKADLFVSIHANAAGARNATGSEIFFLGLARSRSALEIMKRENSVVDLEDNGGPSELSEEELMVYELTNSGNMAISERIATMIEDQFRNRARRRSRGVKQAGLMALWHASTPAVLVELGFLSNPAEARYLTSEYGQDVLASAIFRAIRDFKQEYDRSLRDQKRASNDE